MKVDRKRPGHWLLLATLFVQGLLGILLRLVRRREERSVVVLYGHKLNGNLLALYRCMLEGSAIGLQPCFLTMDRSYHRTLLAAGVPSVWAGEWRCPELLSRAVAIITDHGLHTLGPLRSAYRRGGTRFFDVWHAIPFKGFDAADFLLQHHYDEIWVASDFCRDMYIEKYGFRSEIVKVTGYPRTDPLVRRSDDVAELRRRFGLPPDGKVILFAPTWAQDDKGRSIYPFGCTEEEFLSRLSMLARAHGATVVLRSHLNTGASPVVIPEGVMVLSAADVPDTEAVLAMTDILVCDWSSIAFDFLLLDRPAIFLDVPPPFRKGFSVGPEHRYGAIVDTPHELFAQLFSCLASEEGYWKEHRGRHERTRRVIYGEHADGRSSMRCLKRLQELTAPVPTTI